MGATAGGDGGRELSTSLTSMSIASDPGDPGTEVPTAAGSALEDAFGPATGEAVTVSVRDDCGMDDTLLATAISGVGASVADDFEGVGSGSVCPEGCDASEALGAAKAGCKVAEVTF